MDTEHLPPIEQLEATLSQNKEKLESDSRDSTGAIREHLLHKKIFDVISDKVEFTAGGASLKPGKEDTFIASVSSIDLQKANTEIGKYAGDEYLKQTVDENSKLFASALIYHRGAQNFTIIAEGSNLDASLWRSQEQTIAVSEHELRTSVAYVKLSDVVDLYNSFVEKFENQDEHLRTKIFTELLLKFSEYEREYKIAFDLGEDYLTKGSQGNNEDQTNFLKYVGYVFQGTRFENLDGFKYETPVEKKEVLKEYTQACRMIAEKGAFGEEINKNSYWKLILNDFAKDLAENQRPKMDTTEHSAAKKPKQEFDTFVGEHQTPKHIELSERIYALEKAEFNVNQALRAINAIQKKADENAETHQKPETKICNAIVTINETAAEFNAAIKSLIEIDDLLNPVHIQKMLRDKSSSFALFEDLIKLKLAIEIEQAQIDIELCGVDLMTGLKNKGAFEERLVKMHSSTDESMHVLALDLGFVKYFNKEGNRKIGDATIKAAGFILHSIEENFEGVEVYRTGGDEFSILINGDENQVIKIIEYITRLTEDTGPIPTDKKPLGAYTPEAIQFNYGYCLKVSAEEALKTLGSPERHSFSINDVERLDETSEKFDKEFYTKTLAIVQNMVASLEIDTQKMTSRCEHLRKIINGGDMEHFRTIFPYSGKALQGISPADFEIIVKENPNASDQELAEKINELIDQNKGLTSKRMDIIERVVAEFVAEK